MRTRREASEAFAKDAAEHVMAVVHESGMHRHLRCAKPGTSCYHFDIVTWPGYLAMTGDMGSWVFSREPDMFGWFRPGCGERGINPQYWSEKLVAVEKSHRNGMSFEEYDGDACRLTVARHWRDWLRERGPITGAEGIAATLDHRRAVRELLASIEGAQDANEAGELLNNFDPDDAGGFNPADEYWDWLYAQTRYTFHFLWACHAIVWAIARYDEMKHAAAQATAVTP